MFNKVKLVCLNNEEGKKDWLAKGFDEVIFSADQLRSNLLIGEALPEKIVFDGRLLDFIHLFPMRSIDESCAPLNAYLEEGVAEWTDGQWEFFTCRAAVLGCCTGFYLSVLNKKDLK
ncbi:MAG: hypothetical protein IJ969_02970 [Anaerotignum sp.]|nr:hypothetical protein [Anaerotignum sp.]